MPYNIPHLICKIIIKTPPLRLKIELCRSIHLQPNLSTYSSINKHDCRCDVFHAPRIARDIPQCNLNTIIRLTSGTLIGCSVDAPIRESVTLPHRVSCILCTYINYAPSRTNLMTSKSHGTIWNRMFKWYEIRSTGRQAHGRQTRVNSSRIPPLKSGFFVL